MFRVIILVGVLSSPLVSQHFGNAPDLTIGVTDVYSAFRLPPLKDTQKGGLLSVLSHTQVGKRARALSLDGHSAIQAWSTAAQLVNNVSEPVCSAEAAQSFSGTTTSELNRLLSSGAHSVRVTAPFLEVDQPIVIRQANVAVDFGHAKLSGSGKSPYMMRVESADCVVVHGGEFIGGRAGILIAASQRVHIDKLTMRRLASSGIVVVRSSHVAIAGCSFHEISGAPVLLGRETSFSVVENNEISGNRGPSNFTAGILITDREVDLAVDPGAVFAADGYWSVVQPITERIHPPHDNAIAFNRILTNAASGIYVDGAVREVIVSNSIEGNAKEGLCLDNGSTANVVASNTIERNGGRWGEPDRVLETDHVLGAGRLPDGTAAAKLPAISIDNALYNIVFDNRIAHNYGGGVKIVRTGYFNAIGLNTLLNNNDGAGAAFHFFGIELGATEGDAPSIELDFTPSRGNIVFSNEIRGTHYSGIFFGPGSDQNDVFDNTILDATHWALESVAAMSNYTLNNLTNLPSRNVGPGLDPALMRIAQPAMDSSEAPVRSGH